MTNHIKPPLPPSNNSAQLGHRIRQLRRKAGQTQVALAVEAGISASYLNLIEHHRRTPGPALRRKLALALRQPPDAFDAAPHAALIAEMQAIAQQFAAPGPAREAAELAARFPEWAALITRLSQALEVQQATNAALGDRLNLDPQLQSALHDILTRITAIRATSGILAGEAEVPAPDAARFQGILHSEAELLSDRVQDFITAFDRSGIAAQSTLPGDAVRAFLAAHDYAFDALEAPADLEAALGQILATSATDGSARAQLERWLRQYARDAAALPLAAFHHAAKACAYAPDQLAQKFGVPLLSVFRRLAGLARPGLEAPRFGLVVVNAASQPLYRRPLGAFALPRFAAICALWPLFEAFSTPNRPLQTLLRLPDGAEMLARAIAEPAAPARFGQSAPLMAGMLVCGPEPARRAHAVPLQEVGLTCPLCPRKTCPVRGAPSLIG